MGSSDLDYLESQERIELVSKILRLVLPLGGLVAISGLIVNLIGQFHPYRFGLNSIVIAFLIFILIEVKSDRLYRGFHSLIIGLSVAFSASVLAIGGVMSPNYFGFMLIISMVSAFVARSKFIYLSYLWFVVLGALSFIPPLNRYDPITLPSPMRIWSMYVIYGLLITAILIFTRQTYNKAIHRIAQRETLLDSIFLSISEPLLVMNHDLDVIQLNPSAEALEREIIERSIAGGLMHTQILNLTTQEMTSLHALLMSSSGKSSSYQVKLQADRLLWFTVHISPFSLNGKSLGSVLFLRDMTDQFQLIQSQKLLAVGSLANGIAHDFNNMLGAIKNASELLSLEIEDTEQVELLDMIDEATDRSIDLVNQIRQFSKIRPNVTQRLSVFPLLRRVVDELKKKALPGHNINLVEGSEVRDILGDETQLYTALLNLGINGLQAVDHDGEVQLNAYEVELNETMCGKHSIHARAGLYLCLEVKDNGAGISPEIRERIFEPFFTTRAIDQGKGLGLSAVHHAVDCHQGIIETDSEVGSGTTFRIYLPLQSSAAVIQPKESFSPSAPAMNIHRVLIIDDEALIRKSLQAMLKAMGIEAETAESGAAGLAILKDQTYFDLIILDMQMPDQSGREVFYELKRLVPHIPVILSSGYSPEGVGEELLEQGLSGVLRKPYHIDDLKKVLCHIGEQKGSVESQSL